MATIGNNIIIQVQDGQTWKAIAATKSDRIQVDGELIEINNPDNGQWRKFVMGRNTWMVNVGFIFTQVSDIRKVLLVGTRVKLRIGGTTFSASSGLEGYAWVKTCDCGATINSIATGALVLQGDGALT